MFHDIDDVIIVFNLIKMLCCTGPNIAAVHWTAAILRLGTAVNGLKLVGNMLSGIKCSETEV